MPVARANGVHTFGCGGLLQVPLLGELTVTGGQVVGRPGKAAKTETNTGSLLRLMSIELVMLSNISPSAALFYCLQSFPASGSSPMSQLFISGTQILELQVQHQSFQ